ncbi:RluA family pseudouridine synthase [Ancylobacter pratisalsi]|uniref:RNA pseudouridine synthase n=1 Tax=Ancylobacter pratisalsi TaxID=1745854 RepID=A0A6P1YM10_9HYPH|nr:RNA pseudouridine synthase [Ancylobacter pratisalsi]QIB33273.1 RNA pseudouridine synthase [Ancylobacter pratisalsi]
MSLVEPAIPFDIATRVLHRDGMMLVINKPAGLAVHRGPKGGETLADHLDTLRFGLPNAPELAHRLDKDTSGCLVLGRHRKALADLGRAFAEGSVGKTYMAVVRGVPAQSEGRIELKLSKRSPQRGWWMQVDPRGQEAISEWRVLATAEGLAVLALSPLTGRTHQLRVHLDAIGHPILGDNIYGGASRLPGGPILHLHSRRVVIPQRQGRDKIRDPIDVSAPLPDHMRMTLERAGLDVAALEAAADAALFTRG